MKILILLLSIAMVAAMVDAKSSFCVHDEDCYNHECCVSHRCVSCANYRISRDIKNATNEGALADVPNEFDAFDAAELKETSPSLHQMAKGSSTPPSPLESSVHSNGEGLSDGPMDSSSSPIVKRVKRNGCDGCLGVCMCVGTVCWCIPVN